MDAVYPLKVSEGPDTELRYSLRSLRNIDHDDVFVVGGEPSWAKGLTHIPTVYPGEKYASVSLNIQAACLDPRVSDPFLALNDDFFIVEPITEVPVLWRETIPDAINRYNRRNMLKWHKHMLKIRQKLQGARSYELHVPMVVHKQAMLTALEVVGLGPCWRTAFGAVAGLYGVLAPDVKVSNQQSGLPDGPFVSCSDAAFRKGRVGQEVMAKFPERSVYECE